MVYDERIRQPSKEYQKKNVYVLFGPPGLCKSRWADDHFPGYYDVPAPQNGSWWFDKYQGEEVILFDEYGTSPTELLPWAFLLKLTDGRRIQVPYKGGYYYFKPKTIVFTSNKHPKDWYPQQAEYYPALERRITHLYQFTGYKRYTVLKRPGLARRPTEGAPDNTLIPWLQREGEGGEEVEERPLEEVEANGDSVSPSPSHITPYPNQISPQQFLDMGELNLYSDESLPL